MSNNKPLTYSEACKLKVGDKVICLDTGSYNCLLTAGKEYSVITHRQGETIIRDDTKDTAGFRLDRPDHKLFAKAPTKVPLAPEIAVLKAQLATMVARATKAESRVEAVRVLIQSGLNIKSDGEWDAGYDAACRDCIEAIGATEVPGDLKIVIED